MSDFIPASEAFFGHNAVVTVVIYCCSVDKRFPISRKELICCNEIIFYLTVFYTQTVRSAPVAWPMHIGRITLGGGRISNLCLQIFI